MRTAWQHDRPAKLVAGIRTSSRDHVFQPRYSAAPGGGDLAHKLEPALAGQPQLQAWLFNSPRLIILRGDFFIMGALPCTGGEGGTYSSNLMDDPGFRPPPARQGRVIPYPLAGILLIDPPVRHR